MATVGQQQGSLARALASSDERLRRQALRRVDRLLKRQQPAPLSEQAMRRLWRALYYLLWFADKPLVIEQTIERLCSWLLVASDGWLYFRVMWETVSRYWSEIDHLRLDKYYALLSRALSTASHYCADRVEDWRRFVRVVNQTVLEPVTGIGEDQALGEAWKSLGVALHLCDKWLDLVLLQTPGGPSSLTLMPESDRPADIVVEPFWILYTAASTRASALQLRNRKLLMQRAFERIWQPLVYPPVPLTDHPNQTAYLTDTSHRQQLAERLFKHAAGMQVLPLGRKLMYTCVRLLHHQTGQPMSVEMMNGGISKKGQRRKRRRRQRRRHQA